MAAEKLHGRPCGAKIGGGAGRVSSAMCGIHLPAPHHDVKNLLAESTRLAGDRFFSEFPLPHPAKLIPTTMKTNPSHNPIGRGLLAGAIFSMISLAAAAQDDGFVPMFNGKDLSGWQTTGNWVVEEGADVTLKPRKGESGWKRFNDYITTEGQYGDFILDLEFKFEKAGNSGVFLRVGDLKDHVNSGMEVQILDTHGKENVGHHDCGGIIKTQGPSKNMVKPAGEWNRYIITLKGDHLTVVLNGEQIIDLDLSTSAMKDRPAKGHISFQDEGKPIWYRNVRIKEL